MSFIRGSNPVWSYVDLTGKQFDDTFYMFVLQNTLPYIPATVWHDPNGNVEWDNPIRFFANGTLPIDIYWDSEAVYRLEFRQGNTQQDPLIYLVENYSPGASGGVIPASEALATENQITNPQFSLVNFSSPYEQINVTTQTINVAPGWFLDLTGTGNVTLTQKAFNNASANPTNAPYALEIALSGTWTAAKLRQRFQQNGMLWANTFVSSSITASINGVSQTISAILVDSQGHTLATVLNAVPLTGALTEYTDVGALPATVDTDLPPNAYIEYQLIFPPSGSYVNIDVTVTSIQLISGTIDIQPVFEQDTIQRQLDHTFNYYARSLLILPKDDILTGWNFGLNPWQFQASAITTITNQCQYIADQTILYQLAGSTLKTGQRGVRLGLELQAVPAITNNRFALIQYIDPSTIAPYWGYILSSLARLRIFTTAGTQLGIKMRLIYRATLPPALSSSEPISDFSGTDPVFAAGWTAIAPLNDPVYIVPNSYDNFGASSTFPAFAFNGFVMPDWPETIPNTRTLGIVLYTTANIATTDIVEISCISLMPNEFAIETNPKTFDQVLRECQFYYEKSYDNSVVPNTDPPATYRGLASAVQNVYATGGNFYLTAAPFNVQFNTVKRTISYEFNTLSPASGTSAYVNGILWNNGSIVAQNDIALSFYTSYQLGTKSLQYVPAGNNTFLTTAGTPGNAFAYINFQWVVDARLGT